MKMTYDEYVEESLRGARSMLESFDKEEVESFLASEEALKVIGTREDYEKYDGRNPCGYCLSLMF